jgi:serine/threonine-protein kinase mTOR
LRILEGFWLTFLSDYTIRHTVLSSLHERFDKHLAQAENVRSLFIALNDEVFENRVTAVGLIGRLGKHNPAYVMPSLRKALIQLLTELEYSTVLWVHYFLGGFQHLTSL